MLKHIVKFSNRTLVVMLEIAAVFTLILALIFGGFAWRLSKGPISMAFAKDYIQEALSNEAEGFSVTFDDIVFTWPEFSGRFQLDLKNLRVSKGDKDINALSIEEASVGLSRRALLIGRIRPMSVIIKEPSLELVRSPEGKLEVFIQGGTDTQAPKDPNAKPFGEGIAEIFKDMAHDKRGSFFSRLDEFHVIDASVAVRDRQFGLSWYLTDLDFDLEESMRGVSASVNVPLPGAKGEEGLMAFDIVYRKSSKDFKSLGIVKNVNPYFLSRFMPMPDILAGQNLYFSGQMDMSMDDNMAITAMNFSGKVPQGTITVPEEFDAPIDLKDIVVNATYDGQSDVLNVPEISGSISGIPFKGGAQATITDAAVTMPLTLNVGALSTAQILSVFPKSEHDGEAYEWLGRNIQGANYKDVSLDMELTATKTRDEQLQRDDWKADLSKFNLNFAFDNGKVTYNETLMPAENASGTGTLDLVTEVLEIKDASAMIGDIQGTAVNVKVTDLMTAGGGFVYVKGQLKGPAATALSYISADPINMGADEIGIDAKTVKGTIDAAVDISLPTVKDVPKEQVNVGIKGILTDMNVPGIVEGLALSGGPLNLETQPGGFTVKGSAQLAGRDTTLDWHQYFESKGNPYSMKVVASVGADQELRNHFGVNLDDYISGTMPVDVVYIDKGNGESSVDVKGDLNPVRVHITPFKFNKDVGIPGTVTATAFLKDDVLKELKDIKIESRDFKVPNANLSFAPLNGKKADLSKGSLPDVTLGKTRMNVSFDVSKDGVMNVKASGPVFDLEPILRSDDQKTESKPAEKEKQQPMNISMNADKILLQNNQEAKAPKAFLRLDDEGDITQLEFDATVGKSPLQVRFKPDAAGKRTFRLETSDAGNVLYGFGIYDNVHGGTLKIYGEPKGENLNGNLYGSMQMENFRVVKAPALAQLLSLMSLSGVGQALGSEGLVFSKLESGFEWRFRETGNLLIIKDGQTAGSAIGLTFSGFIDRGKNKTDIAGTIIPMTEVNSILSKIPLVGEILGGSTGLIAATYSMKGPSNNPSVTVNPLSVLAPGIIRRILFEGGYERSIPDDEPEEKAAPAKPAQPQKSNNNLN